MRLTVPILVVAMLTPALALAERSPTAESTPVAAVSAKGTTDWISFQDESATRIVAGPGLGMTDPEEKDLISGDLDKDGDMDLIVARKEPFSTPGSRPNVLFINEGGMMIDRTATLAPDFLDSTDDRDVVLVDVDGDTWLDVVTVTTFDDQPRILMNLGESGGQWMGLDYDAADNRLPTFSPGPQFCAVGFGDVTGDNKADLFFVDYNNNLEDRLLVNDGDGFFSDETAARLTPDMSSSDFGTDGHILDMNGDGWNDIVKCDTLGGSGIEVLYNDGTGNFDMLDVVNGNAPYMVEPGDFSGDGKPDLFVVSDNQDVFLRNLGNDPQGRATFTDQTVTNSPNTEGFGGNVKFADMDGDGILDVLVADVDTDFFGCDRQLVILQGQGPKPAVTYSDPFGGGGRNFTLNGVFDVEAVDLNGDGRLDLWLGTCTGNRIFINTTSGPAFFGDGFEDGTTDAWAQATP